MYVPAQAQRLLQRLALELTVPVFRGQVVQRLVEREHAERPDLSGCIEDDQEALRLRAHGVHVDVRVPQDATVLPARVERDELRFERRARALLDPRALLGSEDEGPFLDPVGLRERQIERLLPGVEDLRVGGRAGQAGELRILLLGLIEEYRRSGADALMYHWIWDKGTKLGNNWGEAGWLLEDNAPMANGLLRMGFEHYKTLRMFDRPL